MIEDRRNRPKKTLRQVLEAKSKKLYDKFMGQVIDYPQLLTTTHIRNFTPHDFSHSEKVEQIADAMLPDWFMERMNEHEIYIFLQAIYLHDIGMSDRAVTEFRDDIEEMFKDELKFDKTTSDVDKRRQIEEKARAVHASLSRKFILRHGTYYNLERAQMAMVASICRAHSNKKLPGNNTIHTFRKLLEEAPIQSVGVFSIHIHLLAALLRLADELDVDAERASIRSIQGIEEMPAENRTEWLKHWLIHGIEFNPVTWEIFLSVADEDLASASEWEPAKRTHLRRFKLPEDDPGNETETHRTDLLLPKERIARNNSHLTDVTIKIRRTLQEVTPTLQRHGLMYDSIRFRDPLAMEVERRLQEYYVSPYVVANIPSPDPTNIKTPMQDILAGIEECKISPEYRVASNLDERLQKRTRFIESYVRNIKKKECTDTGKWYVDADPLSGAWKKVSDPLEQGAEALVSDSGNAPTGSARSKLDPETRIRLRSIETAIETRALNAVDSPEGATCNEFEIWLDEVMYQKYFKSLQRDAREGEEEDEKEDQDGAEAETQTLSRSFPINAFDVFVPDTNDSASSCLAQYKKARSWSKLGIDGKFTDEEREIHRSGMLQLVAAVNRLRDDYGIRRRLYILLDKLQEHMFISVFSKHYLWQVLSEVQLAGTPAEKDELQESFRASLKTLSDALKDHPLTFQLHCFDGPVRGDYSVHSSEVLVMHGGTEAIASREQDDICAFYVNAKATIDDERCYWITGVDAHGGLDGQTPNKKYIEIESVPNLLRRSKSRKLRDVDESEIDDIDKMVRETLGKHPLDKICDDDKETFEKEINRIIQLILEGSGDEQDLRVPGPRAEPKTKGGKSK